MTATDGHGRCDPEHCVQAPTYVRLSRGPGRHADAHSFSVFPDRGPAPTSTVLSDCPYDAARSLVIPECDEHLIQGHFIENLVASGKRTESAAARLRNLLAALSFLPDLVLDEPNS